MVTELGYEFKEKALLLYKLFKLFFVEHEKKSLVIINHLKEKIRYYKDIAINLNLEKNHHIFNIEEINKSLFNNKLLEKNLFEHKKIIQDLINIVNEKNDIIHLLQSDNEIINKELNFWIYDFEKLKLDKNIRQQIKDLDSEKMAYNVNEEMSGKK
jgi:hypothetical protein